MCIFGDSDSSSYVEGRIPLLEKLKQGEGIMGANEKKCYDFTMGCCGPDDAGQAKNDKGCSITIDCGGKSICDCGPIKIECSKILDWCSCNDDGTCVIRVPEEIGTMFKCCG